MTGKAELHKQRPESHSVPSEDFGLRELDARLQDLSDRLPTVEASSEVVCLNSCPNSLDPIVDLGRKMDAVGWMLRVAKHTEGPARERILMTVKDSLDQLERVFDQRLNAA